MTRMAEPSANGSNRDRQGRFVPGHHAPGPGNPFARRTAALRSALLAAVSEKDLKAIVAKLVKLAKAGDVIAAREVLNRCVGRPVETIVADVTAHGMPPITPEDEAVAQRIAAHRAPPPENPDWNPT